MAPNGQINPKSGMLAFDEETGRKIEAVYLTRDAAARRQALRGRACSQVPRWTPGSPTSNIEAARAATSSA
jgi:hypothetical protein